MLFPTSLRPASTRSVAAPNPEAEEPAAASASADASDKNTRRSAPAPPRSNTDATTVPADGEETPLEEHSEESSSREEDAYAGAQTATRFVALWYATAGSASAS